VLNEPSAIKQEILRVSEKIKKDYTTSDIIEAVGAV
jgi:hypothetical protein